MNKKIFNIMLITLAFLLYATMRYLSKKLFLGAFNVSIFATPCLIISVLGASLIINKRTNRVFFFLTSFILLLSVISFIVFMPKYSVNAALNYLNEKSEFEQVQKYKYTSTFQTTQKLAMFTDRIYCFQAEMDSELVLILFNPINGEYIIKDYSEYKWLNIKQSGYY